MAYVGIAGNLNARLGQHFINRDSSVTTGTAAAVINPDAVRHVRWWEHPRFEDGDQLHAGELVAFEVFEPALRCRGNPRRRAVEHQANHEFRVEMERLFNGPPDGEFRLPWIWDLDTRLHDAERRLAAVEQRLHSSLG